jgi:hypothetical protein
MRRAGFELAIPVSEQPQTYALESCETIGLNVECVQNAEFLILKQIIHIVMTAL